MTDTVIEPTSCPPTQTTQDGPSALPVDVVIFGGGVAGLWLLDELSRQHYSVVLIETSALGSGQTVGSQGIVHGGLKYTLTGALTSSAQVIRQMPLIWRDCLAGKRLPDLSAVQLRSDFCYLWRTESLKSQLGMVGARVGLRVKPDKLDKQAWPDVLSRCPGSVYRLDEQVICPTSFVQELARPWASRMLLAKPGQVTFDCTGPGLASAIHIRPEPANSNQDIQPITVRPTNIILAAGAGNAALRQQLGLSASAMQRRPLHMVMARGTGLPELNGHCVDGSKTRVTITTDHDAQGRRIWQVGGQVGEDGVDMAPEALIRHAIGEVRASLPGVDLANVQWATYRVDRAEASTEAGRRPDDVHLSRQGQTFTAWPTKLALAPRLAEQLSSQLDRPFHPQQPDIPWPRPPVAPGPWDQERPWWATADLEK